MQELAKAAGGFVESDPHLPVVRIKPRWPKAAWQIAEAEPDATVPSSVILQINGRRTVSERCNGVFVWAEHAKGRAGDVYRQGSSREPRAAALTDTLYTDTDVLTAAGMAALSDTGIHKTETVLMPVSEKYGIPLGGNQGNAVSVVPFNAADIDGCYWPSKLVGGKPVPSMPSPERYDLPVTTATAAAGVSEA
ncbi:hypothetical protein NEIELOOT_02746 [Neisseria elongata subsp. glycolytica ATCC 29315]|uniref:Uncharacterized protein n=1 Tax=Neisseria elongata subsp. glycolytica ATCC 29315 TaxID=546263 RepID=D4DUI4_NEIEG|nr:hypothetical protein NEIELOOT_02746 [Neisseria elongata subsp. glycolytica ATCC 29315]